MQFHDGWGEFTAADVVHSLQNHQRDDSTHGETGYFIQVTQEAIAVHDHEVAIRLSRSDNNFLPLFSRLKGGMEIISKAHHEEFGDPEVVGQNNPTVGTGSYQFVEREPGRNVGFERIYEHWRTTPEFASLEFFFINEATTRLAALFTGEVHVTGVPEAHLKQAAEEGFNILSSRIRGVQVFAQLRGQYENAPDATGDGYLDNGSPFRDIRVRQALNRAINREAFLSDYPATEGVLMRVSHMDRNHRSWNPRWDIDFDRTYGYDLDAARALLAEAGFSDETPLTLDVAEWPVDLTFEKALVEYLITSWRQLGVDVKPMREADHGQDVPGSDLEYTRRVDLASVKGTLVDSRFRYNSSFSPQGGGVQVLESSRLLKELRGTIYEERYLNLERQIGDIFFDQYVSVPLYWLPQQVAVNPEVVADWVWPGTVVGGWSHFDRLLFARW